MKFLLDTGVLLRLVHPADPQHQDVNDAVTRLKAQGHTFYCGMQNVAEFWNVTTRPVSARSGFGLTPHDAYLRVAIIEQAIEVLTDSLASYTEWKKLVVLHAISGVQVHDAKLVALMNVQGIQNLLTLNPSDFKRFPGLAVATPKEVLQKQVKS